MDVVRGATCPLLSEGDLVPRLDCHVIHKEGWMWMIKCRSKV